MIIGKARRPVSSRIVPYRIVPSSVAETLPERCEDVAEPLHEGLLIEHLDGQHDQDDHGKWAAARGSSGAGAGDPGSTGALVARFGTKTSRRIFGIAKADQTAENVGNASDRFGKARETITSWEKGVDLEKSRMYYSPTGDGRSLADMRTTLLTLTSQREQSGIYDPTKGSVDEQISLLKSELDPIEAEVKALQRASYGAQLLGDALLASYQDEKALWQDFVSSSQPFSSWVMHPDQPDVPVAGAKGFLRTDSAGVPYELDMTLFGSVNIVEGAGTAVMADWLVFAAENNVPMTIVRPVEDATMWYKNFGFTEAEDGGDTMTMDAESIKDWVAEYKKGKGEAK